jgi:hypothetical protein
MATFTHAMRRKNATAPISESKTGRTSPKTCSESGTTQAPAAGYSVGNFSKRPRERRSISSRARASVTPSASRATTRRCRQERQA